MPFFQLAKGRKLLFLEVAFYGLFSSWMHEINSKDLTNVSTWRSREKSRY